jgi:hypothetical protein
MIPRTITDLPWVIKLHQQGMAVKRIAAFAGLPQSTVRTWVQKYGHVPLSRFVACDIEIHEESDGELPAQTKGTPLEIAPPESNLAALGNVHMAAGLSGATTDTPSPLAAADTAQPHGDSTPDGTPRRPPLTRGHLSGVHDEIVGNIRLSATPVNVPGLKVLADVPSEPVEHFWDDRIALGELTIIEGHPGTNKSSLAADLAARLTQGVAMPCSHQTPTSKAGALFLIGEDSISKTVKARLGAAGADLARIGILEAVSIPDELLTVEKAIHDIGAKLVVVDTLNDFLNCNVLGNQAVRKALRPLRDLAEKSNVAVVLLRHFIKNSNGASLLRGGGSMGITAVARSQLKLYKHPDDPHMRVLIHDKSNLGPLSPSLLFEIMPWESSIRLDWHGECMTIADVEKAGKGHPKLDAAEKFLLDHLGSGPKEVNWLIDAARGLCSKRTLDEAKRSLGLETIREGRGTNHKVYWTLQDHVPPATATTPKADELPEETDDYDDLEEESLD